VPIEALSGWVFAASLLLLLSAGYAVAARYWQFLGRFWVIVCTVTALAVSVSLIHELLFGACLEVFPDVARSAFIGGIIWGVLIASLAWLLRRASAALRK
jgi:hypothetical protein